MKLKMKLNKILLTTTLLTNLFSETLIYKIYMKFPYWMQVGIASYEEKSDTLEGKIKLGGIFKIISSLTPIKSEYSYKTVNNENGVIYYEDGKKFILNEKIDVLSRVSYIRNKLKTNELKNNKEIQETLYLFLGDKKRKIYFYQNNERIMIKGLPVIKKVKAYDFNNNLPKIIETNAFGIKFKGELIKQEYEK